MCLLIIFPSREQVRIVSKLMNYRMLPLGDSAFTLELSQPGGSASASVIRGWCNHLKLAIEQGSLLGVVDLVPASRSLTVVIDPIMTRVDTAQESTLALLRTLPESDAYTGECWRLPVCYGGHYGPDLAQVAQDAGMSEDEVIALHTDRIYDILLIGFLPGFPFMSQVAEPLCFPRRTTPRVSVPAGSVAIANDQTAVYPWQSPGGWHLLGRCPVPLFNAEWDAPSLLSPGEQVAFYPINEATFLQLQNDLATEQRSPHSFRVQAADQ